MAQTSFALMTTLGRAKEAVALANATTIEITHIAIGDGTVVPSGGETALYNEVDRKTISGHGTVVGATNVAYFDCFLAANDGPYTIREAGLIDAEGDLIAIARYDPPISKPVPASGQTVEGTIRLEVTFSDVANVTIKVDPSMQVPLQRLTRLPWIPVLSMSLPTPPASPAVGDVYLIPAAPTGEWVGQAGKIAEYGVAGWALIAPPDGHGISLPDGRVFERVTGTYVEKLALDVQSGKWLFGIAGGTANALTLTPTPVVPAYVDGLTLRVRITVNNTGAATINVNGLGAKAVHRADGSTLQPNDLVAGATLALTYNAAANAFRAPPSLRSDILRAALTAPTVTKVTAVGAGTFTIPNGVFSIEAEVWAGGGGAGFGSADGNTAPSGGGGGAYVKKRFPVIPGQEISYVVGAGGLGGAEAPLREGQPGAAGSVTVDGITITAGGGSGGKNAPFGNYTTPGAPSGPYDIGMSGEQGGGALPYANPYGGWGGASPNGGIRTNGARSTNILASVPGGGAAGSATRSGSAGVSGANGEVRLTFIAS